MTTYELNSTEQVIILSALKNLMEDLVKRDISEERYETITELFYKVQYKMDKRDIRLINYFMPDSFPLHRREVEKSSFTCGWCKERIASDDLSTHIRGCRVTIDDVRNDLSTWLEE